jgi:peptidoglycan/LPS O-acetylase OafA/YrhL
MFGIWRTLLALEVVLYHLVGVRIIGQYAVFSFFVLSGFLMTTIMQGTYGYTRAGFVRYIQNRALRLYPSYWFALIVSLILITLFGARAIETFNFHMTIPQTAGEWLENISIIFVDWSPIDRSPRLVPPTWALTVEIFYYAVIGLGLSRSRRLTISWVAVSLTFPIIAVVAFGGGAALYSTIFAGSLPFALGALTWHFRDELYRLMLASSLDRPAILVVMRWLSWAFFAGSHAITNQGWLVPLGNYANVVISALIVCTLFHAKPEPGLRQIDKKVGDYSYPIYLLHWQGTAIASMLIFGELVRGQTVRGIMAATLGLLITIIFGFVCVRFIDPAIERRRTRLRQAVT